jgi:hypothetical protein
LLSITWQHTPFLWRTCNPFSWNANWVYSQH